MTCNFVNVTKGLDPVLTGDATVQGFWYIRERQWQGST